jgi:chromosome segregation ATPase
MNVDTFKTELQQVLDNDIALRKEFNDLKRSLSDYRNQLIRRDEDCKRLQVTIDVLNTKLTVLERDNTSYKSELSAFKELKGTIDEQLRSKQEEIESRIYEIQTLREDLNSLTATYEAKIEQIKADSTETLERVTNEFTQQIAELKNDTLYKENGIKDEFESRLSFFTNSWAEKEQALVLSHEEEITSLRLSHETELENAKEVYNQMLANISSASHEEVAHIQLTHQAKLIQIEEEFNQRYQELEEQVGIESSTLRMALEEQRNTLTTNFNANLSALSAEYTEREESLKTNYESQIQELQLLLSSSSEELQTSFEHQVHELKQNHEVLLHETTLNYEQRIATLINEYEEKLSNTLIHSNSQNSRLDEELSRSRNDYEQACDRITALTMNLDTRTMEMEALAERIEELEAQLRNENERVQNLDLEINAIKENALLSSDEKVNDLNSQIFALNQAHSEYVNELQGQVDQLTEELRNLTQVFENTANSLGASEQLADSRGSELVKSQEIISSLQNLLEISKNQAEIQKLELEAGFTSEQQNKELEYQKLLVENSNIINEIEDAYTKIEVLEAENSLLKAELDEVKNHSAARAEELKETLNVKNYEVTNLEANTAALNQEILLLKREILGLQEQVQNSETVNNEFTALQQGFQQADSERQHLLTELCALQDTVSELNSALDEIKEKNLTYETEITELRADTKVAEQEVFIGRLYKEIESLSEQRLALLGDKEQMANQLIKMNEVVGTISQQIESERIDVTSLNNHRKNVILASNSEEDGNSSMKKQINDLVREIDKCIALLSA